VGVTRGVSSGWEGVGEGSGVGSVGGVEGSGEVCLTEGVVWGWVVPVLALLTGARGVTTVCIDDKYIISV